MKTTRLTLSISQEEKDAWTFSAKFNGQTITEWIRWRCNLSNAAPNSPITTERRRVTTNRKRICRKNNPRCLRIGQCTCKATPAS